MRTNKIEGKFVNLRIAELEDAEFSLSCRQNKEKNTFIPSIKRNGYRNNLIVMIVIFSLLKERMEKGLGPSHCTI